MRSQDFAQFVASQQTDSRDSENFEEDWDGIRNEWLQDLDRLYVRIADFLKEFVEAGSIRYSFTEITLTEEDLGSYPARQMEIRIGRQHVFLEPVGTLLIGFRGRVDAVGSAGRAQLVLVNENAASAADLIRVTIGVTGAVLPSPPSAKHPISWVWKIVSREAGTRFVELDKETFFALLMEIAGA